jgi:hypothetical protein
MKKLILMFTILLFANCASTFAPEIGMTEKRWLQTTLIADLAYMEKNVKAWKSYGVYYYFVDGKLVKVDQGRLPAQTVLMDIKVSSNIE